MKYDNLFKELESVEAHLDGACPRCGFKTLEKRGSHTNPKLLCRTCGARIDMYSKNNQLLDLTLGFGGLSLLIVVIAGLIIAGL